jgi:CHAT domain
MRVVVSVSAVEGGVRKVDVRLGTPTGRQLANHEMETMAEAPGIRPTEGNLSPREDPRGDLARGDGLTELMERLDKEGARQGDVEAIGHYLFLCLLGGSAWSAIVAAAAEGDEREVELALRWPAGENDLNRLYWEAMHDGTAFLGVNPSLSVAVTRIVEDAVSTKAPAKVPAPARVLFAIGAGLDTDAVRPGAEVIGLLRDAERGEGAIDALVVDEVSLSRLTAECERFQPHIVHFVGHGELGDDGGEVRLRDENGAGFDWVDAERLLTAVTAGGMPELVVLTGCETAAAGEHMDSLAAQLVRGGVPAAIGMAGRIADPVCRLFSRNFGRALNTGESLTAAMTHGRRAGLQQQHARPGDDPAWAYPSIYLAPSVPPNFALVDRDAGSAVLTRVANYGLVQDPVFCGRLRFTQLFERLLDGDDRLEVLVAYAEEDGRLGKTRLLHELAGKALRAGHVVVMVDDTGGDPSKLPKSAAELAVEMVKEIVKARQRFGLEVPAESAVVARLAEARGVELDLAALAADQRAPRLLSFLGACEEEKVKVDGDALRSALSIDLVQLIEEARVTCEAVGEHSRAVVVLGGIGNWGDAAELLCGRMLDASGLGTPDEHVPVFLSSSLEDPRKDVIDDTQRNASGKAWIHCEPLLRFREGEDTLAYQWILLHPRDLYPASKHVYTPALATKGRDVWGPFRRTVKGVPGKCDEEDFYGVAETLYEVEWMTVDDDEAALDNYMNQQQ